MDIKKLFANGSDKTVAGITAALKQAQREAQSRVEAKRDQIRVLETDLKDLQREHESLTVIISRLEMV